MHAHLYMHLVLSSADGCQKIPMSGFLGTNELSINLTLCSDELCTDTTHGRKIQCDEAPKVLAPPPTANLAE